jgi:hypothetical protein
MKHIRVKRYVAVASTSQLGQVSSALLELAGWRCAMEKAVPAAWPYIMMKGRPERVSR